MSAESSVDLRDTPLGSVLAGVAAIGVGALGLMLAFYLVIAVVMLVILVGMIWLIAAVMSS